MPTVSDVRQVFLSQFNVTKTIVKFELIARAKNSSKEF